MHEVEALAVFIGAAFDIWALVATAAALRRTRWVADESVAELARSLTLLARDWAKQRNGGEPSGAVL